MLEIETVLTKNEDARDRRGETIQKTTKSVEVHV